MTTTMKRVFIRTFGCQMNIRDSEFVMGLMLESGFKAASSVNEADVILFNSCSVRRHAEDRLFSNISDLKQLKMERPGLVIGLMGCAAQNYKDRVLEKVPMVDLVCGPGNEADLPILIKDILKHGCQIIAADKIDKKRPELFPEYRENDFKAYVSISEGCDNFCSYCIVPYVRGKERYRDAGSIMKEVEHLAGRGFKEITLLGQNVNSYGEDKGKNNGRDENRAFISLLEKLNKIKGIERIKFMTSHPKDASVELFKAMRDLEKIDRRLHLPLQSGSDRILRLMNRKYTRGKYFRLTEEYRKIVRDGAITTDIIVGFPTETEEDFIETYGLMKDVRFDSAYIFKYSPRPHTKAAQLADDVACPEKERRHGILLNFQKALAGHKVKRLGVASSVVGLLAMTQLVLWCAGAANADFETARKSGSTSSIASAEKLFLEGKYERCAYESQRLIDSGSRQRDELYYIKGLSEMKMARFKMARDTFETMMSRFQRSRRSFDAYTGIGDSYFLEGNTNQAIRVYNEILNKFPDDSNINTIHSRIKECNTRLLPRGVERGAFSVQIGSFKNKRNAERLARKLSGKGYKAYVEVPAGSGDKLYRVKAGPFKSREDADAASAHLERNGYRNRICAEAQSSS